MFCGHRECSSLFSQGIPLFHRQGLTLHYRNATQSSDSCCFPADATEASRAGSRIRTAAQRATTASAVSALNERLLKGRMERTLKEDLQDDLQVLVDLIQHSCKPHPRPPRAGMKTLIVQGRILAEAIAQDALFQLDPSGPAAPRPDRDLVDLINRLRDHHPNSLLAPALHVLRTLGNTAVHLDRDSARLTDGEIGDAAAVCCRLVVLVVDAYMQMCANLHKHEETGEALAQPLLEAPVAPIPAPNVLLRPREARAAAAAAPPEETISGAAVPAAAVPPPMAAWAAARMSLPSSSSFSPAAPLMGPRQRRASSGGDGDGLAAASSSSSAAAAVIIAAAGAACDSGGGSSSGGRRRSLPGNADGASRVPYSLVSSDRCVAQQHPHAYSAFNSGGPGSSGGSGGGGADGGGDSGSGGGNLRVHAHGSRGWWPPAGAAVGEAPAVLSPPPPIPMALLRRPQGPGPCVMPLGICPLEAPPAVAVEPPAPSSSHAPQLLPCPASVPDWVQGYAMPYGVPLGAARSIHGHAAAAAPAHHTGPSPNDGSAWGSGWGYGAADGGGAAAVAAPVQSPYIRPLAPASAAPHHLPSQQPGPDGSTAAAGPGPSATAPYALVGAMACSAPSASISSAAAVLPAATAAVEKSGAAAATAASATVTLPPPPIQTDPWVQRSNSPPPPSGGSPRRFPISLTSSGDISGGDHAFAGAATAAITGGGGGLAARGGSPPPSHRGQAPSSGPPVMQPTLQQHQEQQAKLQQQAPLLQHWAGGSSGAGPGPGSAANGGVGAAAAAATGGGTVLSPGEASKRLLQLCATTQAPPAARVERLLQAGATLTFTDKSGMTALHLACYWGHAEAARLLLEQQPSAAAAADREGRTPLWVASQRGHAELVDGLLGLTEGAMQVDVANAAGVTPLRVAAAQGHSQVVGTLLQAGANVDLADKDGFTPLYVAAARSQLEVVRLLLAASAPVDRPDKAQRTPLWAALHPGGTAKVEASPERRSAVVRALLAAGADVHLLADARDREYCWQLLAQSIAAGD